MTNICAHCSAAFTVTAEDREFLTKLSPVIGDQAIALPPPTHCPECRQQRRCAQGNQLHLFKRTCDFTGEQIVSNYAPESPYKVYKQEVWWSDKWDALSHGRDVDFSRPFFEQYAELLLAVPRYALHTTYQYDENSEYVNYCTKNKNCYLVFDSDLNRDCYYGYGVASSQNCMDCYRLSKSELCFECIDCLQCYDCSYLQDCQNCSGSMFLKNCIGCKNCLMCSNLTNKQYWIENRQATEAEFASVKNMLVSRDRLRSAQSRFDQLKLQYPQKFMHGTQNENVVGDYLANCKNAAQCFDSKDLWDCRHIYQGWMALKDCMDLQEVGDCQMAYESCYSGDAADRLLFCSHCFFSHSCLYCSFCMHCTDVFGCVGLNRKKHCVFNKQYSKEAYEALVPRIIEHMRKTKEFGEFFPMRYASFPYNLTQAQDYCPLTKDQAVKQGYAWKDDDRKEYATPTFAPPDAIDGVSDAVCKETLGCSACGRNHRIMQRELDLLRTKNLPLPDRCFLCRHQARFSRRNTRMLFDRDCARCGIEVKTTYGGDRSEKILCEPCYQRALV